MIIIELDCVKFNLKEQRDFSWLSSFGKVFAVFDKNDSGNISFGVDSGKEKYFIKVAGLKTVESIRTQQEAIIALQQAMPLYENIKHPNLIELIQHGFVDDIYIAVFKWEDGECLFDHWNFDKYRNNPRLVPPAKYFKQLPIAKRIESAETLFSFLDAVSQSGYVAVDFYDGSIMYNFSSDTTTICDIDYFRKKPTVNDIGKDYWGTKRLKAPEEYSYGAVIDETTNVYTLGALLFDVFFGNYTDNEVRQRYEKNAFTPCPLENWGLSQMCYEVAMKAVSLKRNERYTSIKEFYTAWNRALYAK